MKKNSCGHCGSSEIYFKEVQVGGTQCWPLLPIGPRVFGRSSSLAAFELRICGACGGVDWFVPERLLPEVKQKFASLGER